MADRLQANKQTAATFLKALGAGDVETTKSVIADDLIAITANSRVGPRDREAVLKACAALKQITRDGIDFEIRHMTAEDDRVAVEVQGHSTMSDGQPYDNQYHFLFFIRDGKIRKLMEYLDSQLANDVLGPYLRAAAQ